MKYISALFLSSSLLIALMVVEGCAFDKPDSNQKPTISVSLMPQKYFVRAISGNDFDINVLLPPGTNHHTYEPTPKQLIELEQSKILFINGLLPFEERFVHQAEEHLKNIRIIKTTQNIRLLEDAGCSDHSDDHDHFADPHTWLSFINAKIEANNILTALVELNPEQSGRYTENFKNLANKIDSIHYNYLRKIELSGIKGFIIYHPALGYLARDYSLRQLAIEKSGKNPTPFELKALIDTAITRKMNTIFIQKEFDIENAKIVAQASGAKIVVIDPMSEDWLENLKSIVDELLTIYK